VVNRILLFLASFAIIPLTSFAKDKAMLIVPRRSDLVDCKSAIDLATSILELESPNSDSCSSAKGTMKFLDSKKDCLLAQAIVSSFADQRGMLGDGELLDCNASHLVHLGRDIRPSRSETFDCNRRVLNRAIERDSEHQSARAKAASQGATK
jgi:hypothetical protein